MKTFLQNHKWIGWLVFLLGLIFSYLSSGTAAHVLLAAGGALVYGTHRYYRAKRKEKELADNAIE